MLAAIIPPPATVAAVCLPGLKPVRSAAVFQWMKTRLKGWLKLNGNRPRGSTSAGLLFRLGFAGVLASAATAGRAQQVGDSAQTVRALLGGPQMARATNDGELWVYANGTKVRLRNGVVTAIEGNVVATKGISAEDASVSSGRPGETRASNAKPGNASNSSLARGAATAPRETGAVTVELPAAKPAASPKFLNGAWSLPLIVVGLAAFATVAICNLIILVTAFKESVLWGLGFLFVPFVSLIFIIKHWSETRKPFLVQVAACVAVALTFQLTT